VDDPSPDPRPVEAALDQVALRLPGFSDHVRVELADGQLWSFPLPTALDHMLTIESVQDRADDRQRRDEADLEWMPEGFEREMQRWCIIERFNYTVGAALLRLNYRLTEADECRLFLTGGLDWRLACDISIAINRLLRESADGLDLPPGWDDHDGIMFDN
jgi:hypothetical protein